MAKDYVPSWARGGFNQYQLEGSRSFTPFHWPQSAVWRQSLAVVSAFADHLVDGFGQPIDNAVARNGIVKQTEPFGHGPVAGDGASGGPMSVEGEFIEVSGLPWGKSVQTRSSTMSRSGDRKDRKVRSSDLSTLDRGMALKKSAARVKRTV